MLGVMETGKFGDKIKKSLSLSFQLAKAGFKQKNEGSFLGILWYLLEPLFLFIVFLKFKNITGQGISHYPLYLFLGLIMFNFFRKTTSDSANAITESALFIKSVKLDQKVFVVASLLRSVFSHFFEIAVFVVFLIYFSAFSPSLVFYPLIFFIFCAFTLGASFFVATLNVYISDFGNLWKICTTLLWFATPIFYAPEMVLRAGLPLNFNYFNPLYYFITLARETVVYGKAPELHLLAGVLAFSLLSLAVGLLVFKKFKDGFVEMI